MKIVHIEEHRVQAHPEEFNSHHHTDATSAEIDTSIVHRYEDFSSWASPGVLALMRNPPFATIETNRDEFERIKEISYLARFRERPIKWQQEPLLAALAERIDTAIGGRQEVFCRIDQCSFKVPNPICPFASGEAIIEAMIEDVRVFGWVHRAEWIKTTKFILSRFDHSIDKKDEYRVFIHRGVVTAISQYAWHTWREKKTIPEARSIAAAIVDDFIPKLLEALDDKTLSSYVVDVYVDGAHNASLIELNPFGALTGCGSALFHWAKDAQVLHSTEKPCKDTHVAKNAEFRLIAKDLF